MNLDEPEGATLLDPDEADRLIPGHITTRRELNEWESRNIQAAVVWALSRRRSTILSARFAKQLHRRMFDRTWEWAGEYRRTGKNIGVPWEQIPVEVHKLFEDVAFWLEGSPWSIRETAVRLHHRMVQIHPFVNGNGRHARLLADVLLFNHEMARIDWGGSKLDTPGDMRPTYLHALRTADRGDYGPLLRYAGVTDRE